MLHFDTIKFTLCRKTQVQDNLDEDCSFTVKTFEYGNVRISTQHVSEKITMGSISHAFLPFFSKRGIPRPLHQKDAYGHLINQIKQYEHGSKVSKSNKKAKESSHRAKKG